MNLFLGFSFFLCEVDNECYIVILWLVKDKVNDGIILMVNII